MFIDAREENGKIVLVSIDSKGSLKEERIDFQNYVYVVPSKKTKTIEKKMHEYDAKKMKMTVGDKELFALKINTDNTTETREELKEIKNIGNDGVYEYTIPTYRKYLLENHQKYAKSIPNMLAVDIETEGDEITMVSFYGKVKKVLTYRKSSKAENVKDEKELLIRMWEIIDEVNPNVILTYNGDTFDFPRIRERMEKHGLDHNISYARRGRISASRTKIIHIDLYQFIANVLSQKMASELYNLSAVSHEILGIEKDDVIYEEMTALYRDDIDKLAKYCLRDSELTYKLGEKLVPQILEMADLVGQGLFDTSRMMYSQLVEWYLSKRAKENNIVIPNQPKYDEIKERSSKKPYEGGFVMEPSAGIHDDVTVVDFRSLYPSIIATHNISPETLNCDCCKKKVPGMNIHFCTKNKGFVAQSIEEILNERFKVRGKDKNRDAALKTIANAMYGYLGFASSKWYSYEGASAAAAYGRFYIKNIIEKLKENFTVIYGDTDSVFIKPKGKASVSKEVERINSSLPGIISLDLQGHYEKGLFTGSEERGTKKRYALYDGKEITVKGLEIVRSDWCDLAKKTQIKVLEELLVNEDEKAAAKRVEEAVKSIENEKADIRDLILRTQLTKPLEEYKTKAPHITAARMMEKVTVGDKIPYFITQGEGSISERAKPYGKVSIKDIDKDYYISKQIVPPSRRVLGAAGVELPF